MELRHLPTHTGEKPKRFMSSRKGHLKNYCQLRTTLEIRQESYSEAYGEPKKDQK